MTKKTINKRKINTAFQNYIKRLRTKCSELRVHFIVIFLFLMLTILFTYPVAFNPNAFPGGGDIYAYLWNFWWFKKANLNFSSPYWTPYLFYPSGLDLAFATLSPLNGYISIPLQSIFNIIQIYNILWLLSFILAGYGTFLLVQYLTKNPMAGFISGLIYTFSPYHFAHALGHLNLLSIQWIPFYILFLFKTIKEQKIQNGVLAAFFLIIVGLGDYTYAMYCLIFTVILILFYFLTDFKNFYRKEVIIRLITLFLIFGVGFFPFIYPLLKVLMNSPGNYMYAGGFSTYSADLVGFFIPTQLHPILGRLVNPIYQNFTGNIAENTVFIGYTVIFLTLVAVIKNRSNEIKLWIISAIVFFILALGPVLHVNGVLEGTIEGMTWVIPLPYLILMKIPIISMARAPSRFDVMLMLSLAVLAGYGFSFIFKKYEGKNLIKKISLNSVFSAIFIFFILFEFLAVPFPMGRPSIPDFYYSIANDEHTYGIYEIPDFGPHLGYPEYMYYQTIHGKPITTGYTKIPDSSKEFMRETPFINSLYTVHNYNRTELNLPDLENDIINQNSTLIAKSIMNYYNIRYIILHENYLSKKQLSFIKATLNSAINDNSTYYPDDHLRIYTIQQETINPFVKLGPGFYELESWSDIPTRWMKEEAIISIYSGDNRTIHLSFQATSNYHPGTLMISQENERLFTTTVPINFVPVETSMNLIKGENIIHLRILEGCEKPADIPSLKNNDSRCISIAIQNITIG